MVELYIKQLQGFQLCASKDSSRLSICNIYVETIGDDKFQIVATDGQIMAWKIYLLHEWGLIKEAIAIEWGANIPDEPFHGVLTLGAKARKIQNCKIYRTSDSEEINQAWPYPSFKQLFDFEFENDYSKMPIFSFDIQDRLCKVLGKFGLKRDYFHPTAWLGRVAQAIFIEGDFKLLAMPIRCHEYGDQEGA